MKQKVLPCFLALCLLFFIGNISATTNMTADLFITNGSQIYGDANEIFNLRSISGKYLIGGFSGINNENLYIDSESYPDYLWMDSPSNASLFYYNTPITFLQDKDSQKLAGIYGKASYNNSGFPENSPGFKNLVFLSNEGTHKYPFLFHADLSNSINGTAIGVGIHGTGDRGVLVEQTNSDSTAYSFLSLDKYNSGNAPHYTAKLANEKVFQVEHDGGIWTNDTLSALGNIIMGSSDGSTNSFLQLFQGAQGTAGQYAYIYANYNSLNIWNPFGTTKVVASEESKAFGISEPNYPWESLWWWFDGSGSNGTGMWIKTPNHAPNMNFQLGDYSDKNGNFTIYNYNSDSILKAQTNGNVGIGTNSPSSTLTVEGVIQTLPRSTAACNATIEGGIYYDSDDSHFYGCNGINWVKLDN